MSPIYSGITNLRDVHSNHMYDTCKLLSPVVGRGSAGSVTPTYSEGPELICGFDPQPGTERRSPIAEPVTYEATIRLPFGTAVSPDQKIRIIRRFGTEVTPTDYEVVSPAQEGPTAVRVHVKRIRL